MNVTPKPFQKTIQKIILSFFPSLEKYWRNASLIALYPGAGSNLVGGGTENGYPPNSHDCNPIESWFSFWQKLAATLAEKRAKKSNYGMPSMHQWHIALNETRGKVDSKSRHALFDAQPKVMRAIIEAEGGRT